MDKKQRISWGVSFGSIALVAGMVSYLGFTNGFKSSHSPAASAQQFNQNADESNQGFFGTDDNSNNNSNSFSDDGNNSFDNGNGSFGDDGTFGGGGFGGRHHHDGGGFSTTTGGS